MAWPSTTACRVVLISSFSMSGPGHLFLLVQIGVGRFHVFLEIERLVLQRMSQFVRQHRLSAARHQPVQQIHGLGFGIVVTRHLLLSSATRNVPRSKSRGSSPNFFSTSSDAAQALRILVLGGVLFDIGLHFVAVDQLSLDFMLDRENLCLCWRTAESHPPTERVLRLPEAKSSVLALVLRLRQVSAPERLTVFPGAKLALAPAPARSKRSTTKLCKAERVISDRISSDRSLVSLWLKPILVKPPLNASKKPTSCRCPASSSKPLNSTLAPSKPFRPPKPSPSAVGPTLSWRLRPRHCRMP